jgi:hypothetical protein
MVTDCRTIAALYNDNRHSTLSQFNSVLNFMPSYSEITFNITIPLKPRLFKWPSLLNFLIKMLCALLIYPCRIQTLPLSHTRLDPVVTQKAMGVDNTVPVIQKAAVIIGCKKELPCTNSADNRGLIGIILPLQCVCVFICIYSGIYSIYIFFYTSGFLWRITMGSWFDDWIYWHFFTSTINYDSSQSMTVYDSLHSLLYHEWRTRNHSSRIELPWTTSVRRITPTSRVLCYDRRSIGQSVLE